MSKKALELYRHPLSGQAHRVELMLSLLACQRSDYIVERLREHPALRADVS